MQSRREDASEEISATTATVSFCCSRGLRGGGLRRLRVFFMNCHWGFGRAAMVYSQRWVQAGHGVQMCVCVTHRGVTTLTHTLPIGKMEHESACLTLQ